MIGPTFQPFPYQQQQEYISTVKKRNVKKQIAVIISTIYLGATNLELGTSAALLDLDDLGISSASLV